MKIAREIIKWLEIICLIGTIVTIIFMFFGLRDEFHLWFLVFSNILMNLYFWGALIKMFKDLKKGYWGLKWRYIWHMAVGSIGVLVWLKFDIYRYDGMVTMCFFLTILCLASIIYFRYKKPDYLKEQKWIVKRLIISIPVLILVSLIPQTTLVKGYYKDDPEYRDALIDYLNNPYDKDIRTKAHKLQDLREKK